jgi:hypothetical protein
MVKSRYRRNKNESGSIGVRHELLSYGNRNRGQA